jgi:hypothetical protein
LKQQLIWESFFEAKTLPPLFSTRKSCQNNGRVVYFDAMLIPLAKQWKKRHYRYRSLASLVIGHEKMTKRAPKRVVAGYIFRVFVQVYLVLRHVFCVRQISGLAISVFSLRPKRQKRFAKKYTTPLPTWANRIRS